MNVIEISVKNKIAKTTSTIEYVCGNSDYMIRFDFDAEWDPFDAKTARIINGDGEYYDVVFTGNECQMPIISDAYAIKVGVFAGNLHTTTPAYVSTKKSILCGSGTPAEPAPDVYEQIMDKVDEACKASDSAVQRAGEYAVNADASAKAAFDSAKNAKDSAQAAQETAEGIVTDEEQRAEAEAERVKAEASRVEAEEARQEVLPSKLTEPSTGLAVGKYFRIAAIDESGHAVLEAVDAAQVGVQDVKVAGESVVADGVANVKLYANSFGTNDTGIYLRNANNAQIKARSYNVAVTTQVIDYAVKAAMCDGKGDAWSEAEQAAARERMCAKGLYRHIAKITVEEEGAKHIMVSTDENGNSFSLSDVIIYTYSPITNDTSANNGYFVFDESGNMFGSYALKGNATKPKYNMAWLSCCGTIPVMLFANQGVTGEIANTGVIVLSLGNKIDAPFEAANRIIWYGNGTIPPGTTFDIWGGRCVMKIAEYKQVSTRTEQQTITYPAEYDEQGQIVREAWEEIVEKQVPVMGLVYRDATPEEIEEMEREQAELSETDMTTEERLDQVESISDMAYINSELALAMIEEMEV